VQCVFLYLAVQILSGVSVVGTGGSGVVTGGCGTGGGFKFPNLGWAPAVNFFAFLREPNFSLSSFLPALQTVITRMQSSFFHNSISSFISPIIIKTDDAKKGYLLTLLQTYHVLYCINLFPQPQERTLPTIPSPRI
jgi:hypothetical protein